ncbi:MAG TPA: pyridine nucleotide-disulfide oxidoreductase, partial [Nocardioidaceae bacterium]|nr:pyridine nucleotide-disulfide oxidoreductase [Nocardioidaceae bacterium]
RQDDAEKNRLCPPSPYGNSMAEWAKMNALGTKASMSFNSEPDVKAWADQVPLNPARVPAGYPGSPLLDDALARVQASMAPGLAKLTELGDA